MPLLKDNTVIAIIEMSKAKWFVAALVPGLKPQPLKKIDADAPSLLKLLQRWRDEAGQARHTIQRIAVTYEAASNGFWMARWLWARDIEAYAIHPASVAVSREHQRAKKDRLDTEVLMRAFLGWLRCEKRHCSTVAIPTLEKEDARRQCPRAAWHDPIGLAPSPLPEEQCPRPMVPGAHGRRPQSHTQDEDRGAGAQACDCAVGASSPRARCRRASACVWRDGGTWEEESSAHPIGNPKLHMVLGPADVEWARRPGASPTDAHAVMGQRRCGRTHSPRTTRCPAVASGGSI
ncbi:hypothetical protein GCM10007880_67640 [Mesorhizobium amorphae]|uniref:hypothetical protein n=1 Tax=Mesorhizobium amorphae TaxID=71433 RepID=UPI00235D06FF|nr:hypothetical protein [Mesorhizobium amorphae]GLR46246.1 hypothetical protein GCM10007880_67640 [Mesorhizobium amorphae]